MKEPEGYRVDAPQQLNLLCYCPVSTRVGASLFTLIRYCAIVFSFALIFANGWFTVRDGVYGTSACWLSRMKQ